MSSDRPLLQEHAWELYADLAALSAAENGALLPFAVTAIREGGTPTTSPYCLFVFENPNCVPISPLLGAGLTLSLRRHPDLVLLWASQLGNFYSAMCAGESGSLLPLEVANFYVREVSGCGNIIIDFKTVLDYRTVV